jgi:hypothetical protein
VSAAGSSPPRYEFVDDDEFMDDLAKLGLDRDEVDDHLRAIEGVLLDDPIMWSGSFPSNPSLRVAVSDSTPHSPNALRVTFRVEGTKIHRLGVEHRGLRHLSDH